MARYDQQHKDRTRQRIIDASGPRLKADGVVGAGVATLMGDAGLTNGAFYAHFTSKDDLVATVICEQLETQRRAAAALDPGPEAVEVYVRRYLSAAHRDHAAEGCPSAALLDEIIRCDEPVRRAYTAGVVGVIDVIAGWIDPQDPATDRDRVLATFAGMVGTLQMARAVTDAALSDRLLAAGIDQALAQLGVAPTDHEGEVHP